MNQVICFKPKEKWPFVCLPSLSENTKTTLPMNEWNLSRKVEHGQSKYSGADPKWSDRALAIGEWTEVSECPFRVRAMSDFHTLVCERFPLDEFLRKSSNWALTFICSDELIIFWQPTVKVTVTSQSFDYNSNNHTRELWWKWYIIMHVCTTG